MVPVFATRIQALIRRIGFLALAAVLCFSGAAKLYAQSSAAPKEPTTAQETPAQETPAGAPQITTRPERTSSQPAGITALPTVSVDAPRRPPRRRVQRATSVRVAAPPPAPSVPQPQPEAPVDTQDARTGTVGVYANSTSIAT